MDSSKAVPNVVKNPSVEKGSEPGSDQLSGAVVVGGPSNGQVGGGVLIDEDKGVSDENPSSNVDLVLLNATAYVAKQHKRCRMVKNKRGKRSVYFATG